MPPCIASTRGLIDFDDATGNDAVTGSDADDGDVLPDATDK